MAILDTRQFGGQGLAACGLARAWCRCQLFDFGDDGGAIDGASLVEQLALFGGEGLVFTPKAHALVMGEFEGKGLDFEVCVGQFLGCPGEFDGRFC